MQTINGNLYYKMMQCGTANLKNNREAVNDLNVFPIPDGDTGDNMYMTMRSAFSLFDSESVPSQIDSVSATLSRGMMLGARGNSGVILSRIFSGIHSSLSGFDEIGLKDFSAAMENGIKESYLAVETPVEGTILTVFREAVRYANANLMPSDSFESYFDDLLRELKESLNRTPDLLDVLKEAGVVDSGGAGLLYFFEGMNNALLGKELDSVEQEIVQNQNVDFSKFSKNDVLAFGYCTEFFLRLQSAKIDVDSFSKNDFIQSLKQFGESIVCYQDDSIVKVHIHTMCPGDVLNFAQKYGEFLSLKVENMSLQHNESLKDSNKSKYKNKKYGFVSVASGNGLRDLFLSLGVDVVVDGGQSMNPSAQDFINAFDSVNADVIFVLPNNGNIILTAKQAAAMYSDASVYVVNTKNIGQGYCAVSTFDDSSDSPESILESMNASFADVVSASVAKAVRNSEVDHTAIQKDEYIGFVGGHILSSSASRSDALLELAEKCDANKYGILLLLKGKDVPDSEASETAKRLQTQFRRVEVILQSGDQPVYDYIMILE